MTRTPALTGPAPTLGVPTTLAPATATTPEGHGMTRTPALTGPAPALGAPTTPGGAA
ncbi:hypothetical protein AB0892_19375 [Streptomyces sp. NPDC005409]|uniref:hypothetical protein n=1 Tax=Streptomyces sp. NPDC005409 TaxID=3155342 RepID=UPI003451BBF8